MTNVTNVTPQRVKLGYNIDLDTRLSISTREFCDEVNDKVLPVLELFNIEANKSNILHYAATPDALAGVEMDRVNNTLNEDTPPAIRAIINRDTMTKFYEKLDEALLSLWNPLRISNPEFVVFNGGRLSIDHDAIREHCTVYETHPEALAKYEEQKRLIDALNGFFGGNAPDMHAGGLHRYFIVVNGEVRRAEASNYRALIKEDKA